MRNFTELTRVLLIWIVILVLGEVLVFDIWVSMCFKMNPQKEQERYLIVGDPQLTDFNSYGQSEGILLRATELVSDIYMKRCYRRASKYISDVIFTGDIFDGGFKADETQWRNSYTRYQWVFKGSVRRLHVPGNHDLGYPVNENSIKRNRWEQHFGPVNQLLTTSISNTDILLLDTTTLDSIPQSKGRTETVTMLTNIRQQRETMKEPHKLVVVTHIPLFKKGAVSLNGSWCGPLRISESIAMTDTFRSNYVWYQNYLSSEATDMILSLKPSLVINGHDHDWCVWSHQNTTTEYTVGTFSWLQGNPSPSMTLLNMSQEKVPFLDICYLPSQRLIYAFYSIAFLVSFIYLYRRRALRVLPLAVLFVLALFNFLLLKERIS